MAASDYISRSEAVALTDQHSWESSYDGIWMEDELRKLSAADVRENVHGRWTGQTFGVSWGARECSVCGDLAPEAAFCCNCGADMRRKRTKKAQLKTGDKYVLKKNTGDLEAGETVVVEKVNEPQGDEFTYCVKISSDSRPGYWGFDFINPGEEPEVVGNREMAVL